MTIPAFRQPWTNGAHAYPEADTFEAAREGFKRRRKDVIFHMSNTGEAGQQTCLHCGVLLSEPADANRGGFQRTGDTEPKPDKWSTWTYLAKQKGIGGGMHYACSWSNLLHQIAKVRL